MNRPRQVQLVAALLLFAASTPSMFLAGCSKHPETDAAQSLQQSFNTAQPEVKQAVQTATTSLQKGQYAEATRALAPIVDQRQLTEQQKEAIGIALQQINQAVAANPALDTREMYEMRAKMFQAVSKGGRF